MCSESETFFIHINGLNNQIGILLSSRNNDTIHFSNDDKFVASFLKNLNAVERRLIEFNITISYNMVLV